MHQPLSVSRVSIRARARAGASVVRRDPRCEMRSESDVPVNKQRRLLPCMSWDVEDLEEAGFKCGHIHALEYYMLQRMR
jgi:hypothetical protein